MAGTAEKSKNQVPTDRTGKGAHQPIRLCGNHPMRQHLTLTNHEGHKLNRADWRVTCKNNDNITGFSVERTQVHGTFAAFQYFCAHFLFLVN